MEDKIPVMPPHDYGLAMLQESLLDNSAEKKRVFLEAKVEPYLSQFNAHSISEIEFIQSLVEAVYDVLLEKGANFRKDSVGLAGITEQNITGNCVLFNFALKLLLENYNFISHYWGIVVLKDLFSRYVHHFATLIELSNGGFYILDPVYNAHIKPLSLTQLELGKVIWLDAKLETHQAIMVYPFKRLVLSQQNFWTGRNLYNDQDYDAADKAFSFAMSMIGEQAGMLQAIFSSNLNDEMGRYGKINPEYTFSVGLVRYQQNRTEEALTHFIFAKSMLPDNPHYCYYSAYAYEKLGKLKEAIHCYKRFVELVEIGLYGDVNILEKIKSLEEKSEQDGDENKVGFFSKRLQRIEGIDELFLNFTYIVAYYAPVPLTANRILPNTHLVNDLHFSLMDRTVLYDDIVDTYQIDDESFFDIFFDTNYAGEIFEGMILTLWKQVKPSTTLEFSNLIQERSQSKS